MYIRSSPILVALIRFILKLSHPLKQSKLDHNARIPLTEGKIGKIPLAPGTNQIAAFAGYRPLALRFLVFSIFKWLSSTLLRSWTSSLTVWKRSSYFVLLIEGRTKIHKCLDCHWIQIPPFISHKKFEAVEKMLYGFKRHHPIHA